MQLISTNFLLLQTILFRINEMNVVGRSIFESDYKHFTSPSLDDISPPNLTYLSILLEKLLPFLQKIVILEKVL